MLLAATRIRLGTFATLGDIVTPMFVEFSVCDILRNRLASLTIHGLRTHVGYISSDHDHARQYAAINGQLFTEIHNSGTIRNASYDPNYGFAARKSRKPIRESELETVGLTVFQGGDLHDVQ